MLGVVGMGVGGGGWLVGEMGSAVADVQFSVLACLYRIQVKIRFLKGRVENSFSKNILSVLDRVS